MIYLFCNIGNFPHYKANKIIKIVNNNNILLMLFVWGVHCGFILALYNHSFRLKINTRLSIIHLITLNVFIPHHNHAAFSGSGITISSKCYFSSACYELNFLQVKSAEALGLPHSLVNKIWKI